MFQIIKEDPDKISEIDIASSFILCTLERNNIIFYDSRENRTFIQLQNHLEFYNLKLSSNNQLVINFNPYIKWSLPIGFDVEFIEPARLKPFITRIYKNYVKTAKTEYNNIYAVLDLTIYLDKDRLKNVSKIAAGELFLEIQFVNKSLIDYTKEKEIVVIQNNYMYQEFVDHIDQR